MPLNPLSTITGRARWRCAAIVPSSPAQASASFSVGVNGRRSKNPFISSPAICSQSHALPPLPHRSSFPPSRKLFSKNIQRLLQVGFHVFQLWAFVQHRLYDGMDFSHCLSSFLVRLSPSHNYSIRSPFRLRIPPRRRGEFFRKGWVFFRSFEKAAVTPSLDASFAFFVYSRASVALISHSLLYDAHRLTFALPGNYHIVRCSTAAYTSPLWAVWHSRKAQLVVIALNVPSEVYVGNTVLLTYSLCWG